MPERSIFAFPSCKGYEIGLCPESMTEDEAVCYICRVYGYEFGIHARGWLRRIKIDEKAKLTARYH